MRQDVKGLLMRWDDLKSDRMPYERLWQAVGEFIRPSRVAFTDPVSAASRNIEPDPHVYDATAFVAQDNFAGGMYGTMTNPANVWFELELLDKSLRRRADVQAWEAELSRLTLKSYTPPMTDFYAQSPEFIADNGAFGTAVMISEAIPDRRRFRDVAAPLSECWVADDGYGEIDTLYRGYTRSVLKLVQRFGRERVSEYVRQAYDAGRNERVEILHVIEPNADFEPGAFGPRGMPYISVFIEPAQRHEISRGGYRSRPFQCARWAVPPGHVYGTGIGRLTLPDVRQLNIMQKALVMLLERIADPTILTVDEDDIPAVRGDPGEVVPGGLSRLGEQMVQFLQPNAQGYPAGLDMVAALRQQIKDAWYWSLLQLVGRTGLTATEVLTREEEKMRLMGPHQGRLQVEWLSPNIARRYDMLSQLGQIPPPPPGLDGAEIEVVYVSPMARAQRSAQAAASARFVEATMGLAQAKPEALDLLDADDIVRTFREGFGAPPTNVLPDEAVERARAARQQGEQAAAALAAGEQGASIIGKVGQALAAQRAA